MINNRVQMNTSTITSPAEEEGSTVERMLREGWSWHLRLRQSGPPQAEGQESPDEVSLERWRQVVAPISTRTSPSGCSGMGSTRPGWPGRSTPQRMPFLVQLNGGRFSKPCKPLGARLLAPPSARSRTSPSAARAVSCLSSTCGFPPAAGPFRSCTAVAEISRA